MKLLLALVTATLCRCVLAACPVHALTEPEQIRIAGDTVMIVTHATSAYDARSATKRGVDEAVRFAKSRGIPVIYLQDDTPEQLYFMDDCNPDYWTFSESGEIRFALDVRHVYVAGGHLEICLSRTLHDVLHRWSKQAKRNLIVTYLMDAIYSNGKSFEETDPYFGDFQRFMRIVTWGRPGGEHWSKLTLLEATGVIRSDEDSVAYLRRILPAYERSLSSDYRVELSVNGDLVQVLRQRKRWGAPTLRFEFVDSAINFF